MNLFHSTKMHPITNNVQKNNPNDYQLVYASQLYGTFFAVGGKFTIANSNIEKIDLTLTNYTGLYNLGMLKETEVDYDVRNNMLVIILHLQVDYCQAPGVVKRNRTIKFDNPIVPVSSVNKLLVTRELHSLTTKLKPEDHLDEGIFDSEFYIRNGKNITKPDRMDDYLPKINQLTSGVKIMALNPKSDCMSTLSNLI